MQDDMPEAQGKHTAVELGVSKETHKVRAVAGLHMVAL